MAIVDWDVHHGNGTQSAFYEEPDVLTISVHRDGLYPADSGSVEEIGKGAGRGRNMNTLPPGSGVGAYTAAFERIVAPAIRAFKPDLLVVAPGFDANGTDPLAHDDAL